MRTLFIALLLSCTSLAASQAADCALQLDEDLGLWGFPPVDPDVFSGITRGGGNPFVTIGDFDSDGKEDAAFLILRAGKKQIAACLTGGKLRTVLISDLYCDDGISSVSSGGAYYNYDNDSEGRYERDGIHAYCYEKAGATYIYQSGAFQRIVDSD
jgi:hypothetical protein